MTGNTLNITPRSRAIRHISAALLLAASVDGFAATRTDTASGPQTRSIALTPPSSACCEMPGGGKGGRTSFP